jgi:hypothetical protein
MAVCAYEDSNETRIAVSWHSTIASGSRAFDNPPARLQEETTSHAVHGVQLFFAAEGPVRDLLREFSTTAPAAVYMPQSIWQVVEELSDGNEFSVERSRLIQVWHLMRRDAHGMMHGCPLFASHGDGWCRTGMHAPTYAEPHFHWVSVVFVSVQRSSPVLHRFLKGEFRQSEVLRQGARDLLRDMLQRARAGLQPARAVAFESGDAPRRQTPGGVVVELEGKL